MLLEGSGQFYMVFVNAGWLCLLSDGYGRFYIALGGSLRCWLVLAPSRWILPVKNRCGGFGMVVAGLIWLLVVL